MPLFGRRRAATGPVTPPGLSGLSEMGAAQGWQPAAGLPFGHDLTDGIHDITRAMYGDSRLLDATPQLWGGTETGNPAFDDQFRVNTTDAGLIRQILTPEVQQRIMMRDDWVFWLGNNMFACIAKGKFHSIDEVSGRVTEMLGIVTAIPDTVLPSQVDQSADDLMARIGRLDGIEDAIAFLQDLTPADRERLARSDTPLAAFADVRTPEEAMARFGSLPEAQRMQLVAMFMREAGDGDRAATSPVTGDGPGGTAWSPGCSRRSA